MSERRSGESPCAFAHGWDGWVSCVTHGWTGSRDERSRVLVCPEAAVESRMTEAYRETIARLEVARAGMDDRLVRYLTAWIQRSGWVLDYEHARAEAEAFASDYALSAGKE